MSKGLTSNKSTNININYMLSQFRCYVLIEFEFYQDPILLKRVQVAYFLSGIPCQCFGFQIQNCVIPILGVSFPGMPGVPWPSQILADQLTPSQSRGADYVSQIILAYPDFQTFLLPCIIMYIHNIHIERDYIKYINYIAFRSNQCHEINLQSYTYYA